MRNLYLIDPYLTDLDTKVVSARAAREDRQLIELEQTIIRPAGGGQPADNGSIRLADGSDYRVIAVDKSEGKTWVTVACPPSLVAVGQEVRCSVDQRRRTDLMRCHSLIHLLMAGIRWNVPGYVSRGASIDDDARTCRLWFATDAFDNNSDLGVVDRYARSVVAQKKVISTFNVKSVEFGRSTYAHWRLDPSLELTGKVRVVEIADVDANPCSGTHVSTTGEIGPFSLTPTVHSSEHGCFELIARREETWQYWYGE